MSSRPPHAPDQPATASRLPDVPEPATPEPPPFVHLGPGTLTSALAGIAPERLGEFTGSWHDLPADTHLNTASPYRFRRYGTFRFTGGHLAPLPHGVFFQDRSVNKVHGGVPRLFAPLREDVARGEVLRTLVRTLWDHLPGPRAGIDTCGVHQIRVTATAGAEGHPAPEGVHQDGHCYVAQVLIRRQDVRGAESCLYDLREQPVHRAVLTRPLETVVLDDRRVLHGVSPIRPAPGTDFGTRDMLLVDFFTG
ncbi:2OG-Fe dioxygenase family protein [Streptomyces stramineus]|uniref:2OG-Fe dioxygenase family protein n=1 Tax=Streptomyces stramineus TaxID=173861 RepID=A0ABN0ZYC6_9ACTN